MLLDDNKKRKRKVYDCFYVQWRRKLIAGGKKGEHIPEAEPSGRVQSGHDHGPCEKRGEGK